MRRRTFKDGTCALSGGGTTICPIGAFPTKYVWERSPRMDVKADSAHCRTWKLEG